MTLGMQVAFGWKRQRNRFFPQSLQKGSEQCWQELLEDKSCEYMCHLVLSLQLGAPQNDCEMKGYSVVRSCLFYVLYNEMRQPQTIGPNNTIFLLNSSSVDDSPLRFEIFHMHLNHLGRFINLDISGHILNMLFQDLNETPLGQASCISLISLKQKFLDYHRTETGWSYSFFFYFSIN